jgi:2-polyprenyl-6-methoxyphenol hydroxylase-like FAD-dependent oxidoreductase
MSNFLEKRTALHVIVIGGGLGGLCLAQGLKQSGIGVEVYERDASARFRSQGYRLSIKAEGGQALRDCLPESLFSLCVATSIKPATRMVSLDHQLHQSFMRPLAHSQAAPDAAHFGVNRLTLREILLSGLDDTVRFGKIFERFEHASDGQIRACFSDGTSADGDLLVGAEGTSSVVRRLLVPEARMDPLRSILYGKTPIAADTLEWMPEVLIDTFNNLVGPEDVFMSIATCRAWESAAIAAAKLVPKLSLTDVRDYFSWTLSLIGDVRDANGLTLHRLACDTVKEWHPAVRRLVAEADIPAIIPITINSARPVEPWHSPNVTLLGDAIHTMSPGRGEGANTALRDAALLCHALVDVVTKGIPLIQAKVRYEREMLRYGFEAVDASLNAPFLRRQHSRLGTPLAQSSSGLRP